MSWRWHDAEQTTATNGEGAFAPASALIGQEVRAFQRFESLEDAKATLVMEVEARARALRFDVAGTNDAGKLVIYREKHALACAGLAGDAAKLAALADEAGARGQSPAELATLVKSLGDAWIGAGLAIDAACQRHKAAIAALADIAAAERYDIGAGWP